MYMLTKKIWSADSSLDLNTYFCKFDAWRAHFKLHTGQDNVQTNSAYAYCLAAKARTVQADKKAAPNQHM